MKSTTRDHSERTKVSSGGRKALGWLLFALGLSASAGYVHYAQEIEGRQVAQRALGIAAESQVLPAGGLYRPADAATAYPPLAIYLSPSQGPVRVTVRYVLHATLFRERRSFPTLRLSIVAPDGRASAHGTLTLTRPRAGGDDEVAFARADFPLISPTAAGTYVLVVEQLPGADVRPASAELMVRAGVTPVSIPVVVVGAFVMLVGLVLAVRR